MQIWGQGKHNETVRKEIGDGRLHVEDGGKLVTLWRSQIQDVCDEAYYAVLDLWWRWRTFGGLPFAGGWAEQPAHIMCAIETAENGWKTEEARQAKQAERRNRRGSRGAKGQGKRGHKRR